MFRSVEAVREPISTKPKPQRNKESRKSPFLSSPAAAPIGDGKLIPQTSVSKSLLGV